MKLNTLIIAMCGALSWSSLAADELINPNATAETKALYENLADLGDKVLFGHEDSLAYGAKWWGYNADGSLNSDIEDVTGRFAAVFGADVGGIGLGNEKNLDGVKFSDYAHYIKETFKMGGVNTISWHMYSPIDEHHSWAKTSYVRELIPGAAHHDKLKKYLDSYIAFNETLKVSIDGKEVWVPIIFRPWHEHNGDWFWWGKGHTTEADYIALWKFTVDYLKEKGQNNLIFAFSPDRSRLDMNDFEDSYQYGYAGDDYVDIIGYDNYWDLGHPSNTQTAAEQQALFVQGLEELTDLAEKKGKVSALTEGGQEGVRETNFWTERFAAGIWENAKTSRIAYALVWRNNNEENGKKGHYYGAYPQDKNAGNFVTFSKNPSAVFVDNIPAMYK
ncbi:glycosyl transferase family 1 [Vibrio sp. SM6]|uniref:Glycosyl transferase family 1 n=1 Tax=Vibrio agarilyticus TaxID=2726741 RepID=A0A7X8YG28_9VIBR|nr:glycosyl hydrolase [Vibrio agarilyticus]NLS12518.1 glycosyl transferase family 1 [Vibrio agarilyticus]